MTKNTIQLHVVSNIQWENCDRTDLPDSVIAVFSSGNKDQIHSAIAKHFSATPIDFEVNELVGEMPSDLQLVICLEKNELLKEKEEKYFIEEKSLKEEYLNLPKIKKKYFISEKFLDLPESKKEYLILLLQNLSQQIQSTMKNFKCTIED